MSLVHTKNNTNVFFQNKDQDYSLDAFEKVERRINTKKIALDDIKNELDLLMKQAIETYKSEVIYIYIGQESVWEEAQKWISMLKKGTDSEGNKINKRKKYPEKTSFEFLQSTLRKILGIETLSINNIINYNYTEGYEASFTYLDHEWAIYVPMISNIQMEQYERYGAYCFKLKLYFYTSPNSLMVVGDTFEEDDLKDILQLGIEKYCNTKNEES
jgi:NADH dehydrogenase/NADH:ubiquinone oxidoreductase subunit G